MTPTGEQLYKWVLEQKCTTIELCRADFNLFHARALPIAQRRMFEKDGVLYESLELYHRELVCKVGPAPTEGHADYSSTQIWKD